MSHIRTLPGIPVEEARQLLARLCASPQFRKAPRLREFLTWLVERSLEGRQELLTEYEIGRAVFERGADYVPSADTIVRTSARQLRTKLKEYFDGEGKGELWTIDIPKGGFVPVFSLAPASDEPAAASPPLPAVRRLRWIPVGVAALAVSLLANGIWVASRFLDTTKAPANLVAELVATSTGPTQVVLADYGLVLQSIVAKHHFSVEEYVARAYATTPPPGPQNESLAELWGLLGSRSIASQGELLAALYLVRAASGSDRITVRDARSLNPRDFRTGSFILVGAPSSNPWTSLYEPRLGFRFVQSGDQAGFEEAGGARWLASGVRTNTGSLYARIALVTEAPGARVLILTGVNMVTAEAAAEVASEPLWLSKLRTHLSAENAALPDFEAILKIEALQGAPRSVQIVKIRPVSNKRY